MTVTTEQPHTDIATLEPNAYVDGVYSLINPQMGATRGGKPFLKAILRDASGEIVARQWSFDESTFSEVGSTGFAWIAGHTQLYNQQIQLIIEQIRPVNVSVEEMRALLPCSRFDIDEMYADVCRLMGSLEHPAMQALAKAYLDDDDLMTQFKVAPAAVSMHHAWIGGLLEHTLQLLRLADAMLPCYPDLNRDIILMGLFLHDLAKTSELTWERGFNYTADGNLVGHIVRGAIWLQFKAAVAARESGQRLPSEALRVLQHIVLSHHGLPEHGAARVPSTPEAIFVAQLDNLDAKSQMAITAARSGNAVQGADFTDRIWALDTRLYRPDPLRPAPAPDPAPAAE